MTNSTNDNKYYSTNDLCHKVLYLENVSELGKLEPELELCIIQSDFEESELELIKKLKVSNKDIEFWISSQKLSKENILLANKIGIKSVIFSPVDYEIVEEFFKAKTEINIQNAVYACSEISNLKVMIVDDNQMNVELLEETLSEFNLDISSFIKPKEAFQLILHEKFDLFLLDIMMPDMSGFELAKKIKRTSHNKNALIVFISALSDSSSKIKGYDLGSCAYIEKPFDVKIIKSQIFNILKTYKNQEILSSNKENFLATIAHDLKTPISAGINALNLLLNRHLGELELEQHEIVEDILNSNKFMKDMVENILSKSKMDNQKIILSKQVCPLKKVVEHCIDLTKYILEPKNQHVKLQCNLDNTLLPLDFLEMKRVIHNLIANASDHSPIGSVIAINIFKSVDKMGLFIQDFGRGIDLRDQKDIFAQYMSLAKKHKRVGSGLGLYITKKIVEAHDGEIKLESKVGYGTKITIILPCNDRA